MKPEQLRKLLQEGQKACSRQCDQCLFSKNKVVTDKRAKEILEQCKREQTHFICHKGTINGLNLVCRGFYEHKTTAFLELMKVTGRLEFIDPMSLGDNQDVKAQQKTKKERKQKKGL